MAKYCGKVGFATTVETPADSGIWKEVITKKGPYHGDLLDNTGRMVLTDNINTDIKVTNRISIVADPYAMQNFHSIRFAEFMGSKWTVSSVQVAYPRLILNLGELWNGEDEINVPAVSENENS